MSSATWPASCAGRSLLISAVIATAGLLVTPQSHAVVNVEYGTVDPHEINVTVAPEQALDLRIFEYAGGSQTRPGPRFVMLKLFGNTFDLRSSRPAGDPIFRICNHGRFSGSASRNPGTEDRRLLVCRVDRIPVSLIFVRGTNSKDLICVVEPANDELYTSLDVHSENGDDSITGGSEYDELNGGIGNDILRGGDNDDDLFGLEFPDDDPAYDGTPVPIDGDYLYGEQGDDDLWGGPLKDTLVGGEGLDGMCATDPEEYGGSRPRGCTDTFRRDPTVNLLYGSEPLQLDLDTELPPDPTPVAQSDTIDCGAGTGGAAVQYDQGSAQESDRLIRCPSFINPTPMPAGLGGRHKIPSAATGFRTCPPKRSA